jgi:hypothetical protein
MVDANKRSNRSYVCSIDKRELMMIEIAEKGEITYKGQDIIRNDIYFYALMKRLSMRKPNPLVEVRKMKNNGNGYYHNVWYPTVAGENYALFVKTIREQEGRQ